MEGGKLQPLQAEPEYPSIPPQEHPPNYENWYVPNEDISKGPYNNPLTVGLITSVPVNETRNQAHTIVIMPVVLGRLSARMNCPHCLADVQTGVRQNSNWLAYVSCLVLFLFGCWCCCCIPFCMDACHDVEHTCPNCSKTIGRRNL